MIIRADARNIPLADRSVQCVVTSPPYYGLRDYGTARWDGGDAGCGHLAGALVSDKSGLRNDGRVHIGPYDGEKRISTGMPYRELCGKCGARRIDAQIGLEPTIEAYIATMVEVFREVKRVLRDDGCLFLNLGDSYSSGGRDSFGPGTNKGQPKDAPRAPQQMGIKPKDLLMMPARVALALQADGWYLRSDIIWHKPNPMPESVRDRPTRSHEYLFLLTKSERYFYDADEIREPHLPSSLARYEYGLHVTANPNAITGSLQDRLQAGVGNSSRMGDYINPAGRNKRDVWTINSEACAEAHFATFPQKLVEPCILAGTSEKGCCEGCGAPWVRQSDRKSYGDWRSTPRDKDLEHGNVKNADAWSWGEYEPPKTIGWQPSCACNSGVVPCVVFDPFLGSGTVGKVCERLGRRWVGLELSAEYIKIAKKRTAQIRLFSGGEGGRGGEEPDGGDFVGGNLPDIRE